MTPESGKEGKGPRAQHSGSQEDPRRRIPEGTVFQERSREGMDAVEAVCRMDDKLRALRRENRALRESAQRGLRALDMLRKVEWEGVDKYEQLCCPACYGVDPTWPSPLGEVGHTPDCPLARLLA